MKMLELFLVVFNIIKLYNQKYKKMVQIKLKIFLFLLEIKLLLIIHNKAKQKINSFNFKNKIRFSLVKI